MMSGRGNLRHVLELGVIPLASLHGYPPCKLLPDLFTLRVRVIIVLQQVLLLILTRPTNLAHQGGATVISSVADLLNNSRREAADAQLGILIDG